jgi:hypothetical protein
LLLVETGDRLLWFLSWELTRSQPVATSGVAAPRGAGLGQTRLVVVSWEPSASATTGAGTRRTGIRGRSAITMARSSGNVFFANFSTYDAPFPTKARLALANNWRKVRTRSDCCGNYGQPGC